MCMGGAKQQQPSGGGGPAQQIVSPYSSRYNNELRQMREMEMVRRYQPGYQNTGGFPRQPR